MDGRKLEIVRDHQQPGGRCGGEIARRELPRVVVGARYGWYWAADVLQEAGRTCAWRICWACGLQLPTVKNNQRYASDLADLLQMSGLPQAWIRRVPEAKIAPPGDPRAARTNKVGSGAEDTGHGDD